MNGQPLSGRVAVVTGGGRGIGAAIAQALHEAGAAVAITGRNAAVLEETAERIGERCRAFVCDIRDPQAITQSANQIVSELGSVEILVNNAAVRNRGETSNLTLEEWNEVIETNLTGVFLTTKAFLPDMLDRRRGDIFMISSMSGKKGDPGAAAYAASKFGLQGFAQALMYETRRSDIRVMTLCPSQVDTGPEPARKRGPNLYLHANDIAATVVYLAAMPGRALIREMELWGTNPF